MAGSQFQELRRITQSLWYDNIQRRLLQNGELAGMIERGEVRGVTSNPTIFQKAIASSNDYDSALQPMALAGWSAEEIFYQLAIDDIRAGTDLFAPLYKESNRGDGYVSIEVSPYLAHDTESTIAEAKRLWKTINRPNLMIKIPATIEGLPAITEVIASGINVNVTLIFSIERYEWVIDAYMSGLEKRLAAGKPIDHIHSVASFFVSRLDSKVDKALEKIIASDPSHSELAKNLIGKAAIANTRLAYDRFKHIFSTPRWEDLRKKGANPQRPLWASTGTKNPAFSDVIYVEELIAPITVNTVPPATLDAFRDHGKAALTLEGKEAESSKIIEDLESLGISLSQVTTQLEVEGVKSFSDSFTSLLETIEQRQNQTKERIGSLADGVKKRVSVLDKAGANKRLFEHDPSLWVTDPAKQVEISNRLGWLNAPQKSVALLSEVNTLLTDCLKAGYTHALLLGMGGSSLAPEVLRESFGYQQGSAGLDLAILDSTDPVQVKAAADRSPVSKTLYIVSSKSGTTSEIQAFLDYFWSLVYQNCGESAGEHFVAVSDPGTKLEEIAKQKHFRKIFAGDPEVGGRFSALTGFGVVPAGLMGLDVNKLLSEGQKMAEKCSPCVASGANPGLVLGALLGEACLQGKDKLVLICDSPINSFGTWLEQLIAESTGKDGKGIVPIEGMPSESFLSEAEDILYVNLKGNGENAAHVKSLVSAMQPVIEIEVSCPYQLGAEFYRWEYATAIASAVIGVNGFNQPDVQDSKTRTAANVAEFRKTGKYPESEPIWKGMNSYVYGKPFPGLKTAASLDEVVERFLDEVKPVDYIAVNLYIPRNPENVAKAQEIRKIIGKATDRVVTVGFGPRFLHSTGQLHKGGANNGLFLLVTADPAHDMEIPNQGMTFGNLERAQALGDLEALVARERRVIRIHLTDGKIERLVS